MVLPWIRFSIMEKIWDMIHWVKFIHREVGAINYKRNHQGGDSPKVTLWVQFSCYLILEMITQWQNNQGHLGFMLHTTLTKYVLQSMKSFNAYNNASNISLKLH